MIPHVSPRPSRRRLRRAALALAASALAATTAPAVVFTLGDVNATFDSTFSVGGIYRLDDPDPKFFGTTNGGQQTSVNVDDGNLNYREGWASRAFKGTHDLELKWGDFGAFVRGTYFYDAENKDDRRARTPLSDDALDRVGRGAQWLDMYVRGRFDLAGRALDLRFGRQVLSLGESTFIPNGINVINPIDVSRLRVPGSELREALLPVNMLKASYALSDTLSLEAFWLLEFRRTEIDPAGSFFSSNDFATRGGSQVFLGFGALSDRQPLGAIPRDRDREGNNYSQYGADLRFSARGLGDTEFGLFFANYHSRLPLISARTPTAGISPALVQSTALGLGQQQLAPAIAANTGVPAATASQVANQLVGLALQGVPASTLPTLSSLPPYAGAFYSSAQTIARGAGQVGLLTAAGAGRYFIEYPEDIQLYGVSFNTSLGGSGIAWQGEVALKQDVPLQVDDVELLFAALSSLDTPGGSTFGANNQLGDYRGRFGAEISGYRRENVWSAQTTFTKVFGPMLRASQLTVLGEIGGIYVPGLPSKDTLRFDGSGTFTSGNQLAMNAAAGVNTPLAATPYGAFADEFSWGYQLAARLDYNNLFAGVNLAPSLAFVHDVRGNTPLPLGNFVKGRKSVNLAAEFSWQNAWAFELRYVNFFGGDRFNLLADRDYAAATLKYAF